ncbi:MAG: dTMP kinase [Armatimonadota bacterium]
MNTGRFITFEGPDGAGKTTQIARIEAWLGAEGRTVVRTREPGGDAVGEKVRGLLLGTAMTPEAEFLLFAAARAQNVAEVVEPALAAGAVVLCDRFTDSSLAYQGHARGLSLDFIRAANTFATRGRVPDRTVLLDLPAEVGSERRRREGDGNRLDNETLAFHRAVREGYLQIAAAEPDRFVIVDAGRDPDAVFEDVRAAVRAALG